MTWRGSGKLASVLDLASEALDTDGRQAGEIEDICTLVGVLTDKLLKVEPSIAAESRAEEETVS